MHSSFYTDKAVFLAMSLGELDIALQPFQGNKILQISPFATLHKSEQRPCKQLVNLGPIISRLHIFA
jgi:hypothetical protein